MGESVTVRHGYDLPGRDESQLDGPVVSSALTDTAQADLDTRAAPIPLPRPDAVHHVIAIVVDCRKCSGMRR